MGGLGINNDVLLRLALQYKSHVASHANQIVSRSVNPVEDISFPLRRSSNVVSLHFMHGYWGTTTTGS